MLDWLDNLKEAFNLSDRHEMSISHDSGTGHTDASVKAPMYREYPLFLKIEDCGFRDTLLLFRKTKDAVNEMFIALLVFMIQSIFENDAFWDPPSYLRYPSTDRKNKITFL